jgi:site-specific recombinase XerD
LKGNKMTLKSAVSRFLRQLEADGRSTLTIRVYVGELERFGRWLGRRPLLKVGPDTIARYLTDPAATVSPDGTERSARTVNRTKTVLRLLFGYLAETGALRKDPSRLLKNARTDRRVPNVFTDDEVGRFERALEAVAVDSAIGKRDRVLFALLLRTGMRLAAALAIDADDFDLDGATVVTRGKHARVQSVFLPRDVVQFLRGHLEDAAITSGPVFRSTRGLRLSARQAQYRFHTICELAKIERRVTVHSLRHGFANRLRRKNGDLRIVQAALGHRHLATTAVYTHVGDEEVRRALA